jgi:ABC-type transport system substrate-binding protein
MISVERDPEKIYTALSMKVFPYVQRLVPLAATILLLSGSLLSCCPEDPRANYLNLIINTEPKSLDPAISSDITTGVITSLMYDNLVQFGVGSEIIPGIASSWHISPDGKVYTFHLRNNVRFWDGTPLNAADVRYSFERVLAPETRSPQTWLLTPILGSDAYMQGNADGVRGITVENDSTLILKLKTPFAPFLGFLGAPALAIVPKHYTANLKNSPLGSGPWIFTDWQADREVSFKKNPQYFKGAPLLDGLILHNIPEILTAAIEFEAGNLDVMLVPNSEFKYWTHSTVWQPYIHTLEELGLYYLAMNVDRKPFNDVRVRQAVTLAIDRQKIIKRIYFWHRMVQHKSYTPFQ